MEVRLRLGGECGLGGVDVMGRETLPTILGCSAALLLLLLRSMLSRVPRS